MGKGWLRRLGAFVSSLALVASGAMAISVLPAAAASSGSNTREISASGVTSIGPASVGTGGFQSPEIANAPADGGSVIVPTNPPVDRSHTDGKAGSGSASGETGRDQSGANPIVSFDGLNHVAQRTANGGNQFSVEPPDQGLCVGNGYVMESVNDVLNVYSPTGASLLGVTDLNSFYRYSPAIVRGAASVYGPFVTDPSCYYDSATRRWFQVALTLETFPNNGYFTGQNHLDLAVSQTADPLGIWNLYTVQVQDDGNLGTPEHRCSSGPYFVTPTYPNACLGDYPHIGADANGFYITTNEYSFFGPEFKAAQVYAFSKQELASLAQKVSVTQIDTTKAVRHHQAGFTVWPAEAANGHFATGANGTEYFLSSNAAAEVNPAASLTSRDLIVWALTNTASLNSASPDVSLSNTVTSVDRYAAPPLSNQKAGSTPLRDCLNDTTMVLAPTVTGCWNIFGFQAQPAHEVESVIDSNDTRMQQVMYADGRLYGALDTALTVGGKAQAGIEWFSVSAQASREGVQAEISGNGYLGARDTNLTYPAVGVDQHGNGVIAFSLLGTHDYPSAAYAAFNGTSGPGGIHVAAAGVGPDDGFTSYAAFVGSPPRTRWGDYGAAVVDGSNVWIASEYIGQTCTFKQYTNFAAGFGSCGGTRTALGNWDTRITELAIRD